MTAGSWAAGQRRWVVSGATLLLAVGLAAVYWPTARTALRGPESGATWMRVHDSGVLRVGLDPSFPPFEVDDARTITGYDVDLARALADRWGVELALVPITFDGLVDGLLADQYDVIVSAFPYDPRLTEDVAYSQAYFNAGQVLVVAAGDGADAAAITRVEDLAGHRLAVEWGSGGDVYARRLAERLGNLELVPYETPDETLAAVRNGWADAALVDSISAYGYIRSPGGVQLVGQPLTDERYVMVVRPDSRRLLAEINAALADLRSRGVLRNLQSNWF
jgi:ABC-type amino acid transport substrate-binding protein